MPVVTSTLFEPTCTDEHGVVHSLMGSAFTYCGWARVWADGEWRLNVDERHVTCLECLVTLKPA